MANPAVNVPAGFSQKHFVTQPALMARALYRAQLVYSACTFSVGLGLSGVTIMGGPYLGVMFSRCVRINK
jgi:hypothetical protein